MSIYSRRYYLLVAVAVCLATIFSLQQTSDRSWGSIIFNIVIVSGIFGLIFVYMDYVFTVLKRYSYMKYFYMLFVLTFFYYFPLPFAASIYPVTNIITLVAGGLLVLLIIISNTFFYIKVSHIAKEEDEIHQAEHAIHIFSRAYERHKESKDPLEIQIYDLFAEKIGKFTNRKLSSEEEKVNV